MFRAFLVAGLAAGFVLFGTTTDSWGAAQLDATINPNEDESPFKMSYLKTIHIWYENGGAIADEMRGQSVEVNGMADSDHPDMQPLINKLNTRILESGSQAMISNLAVEYSMVLSGGSELATIDYKVKLEGHLTNYVIATDGQKTLIDLGWRGMSVDGPVMVDGHEINDPLTLLEDNMPVTYDMLSGTDAEIVFDEYLINADFVLEQPLENWHFLYDPTGIISDTDTYGLSDDVSGVVVSTYTMGESNLKQGRQVERIAEAAVMADQEYVVRSIQAPDQGNLYIIGYSALDTLGGIDIAGVTETAPSGIILGDFSVFVIYGMAGMAAVAGIAFFFVSNRSLKNEKQGQQGIDPSHLVGYQTSSASGGYQTNRGEAQLRGDVDYQQTRSHYDQSGEVALEAEKPPESAAQDDATCGCLASAEMGSECDCDMQTSCICDHTCMCSSELCVETSASMR